MNAGTDPEDCPGRGKSIGPEVRPDTVQTASGWTRAARAASVAWAGGTVMLFAALFISGLRFYRLRYFREFIDESDNVVVGWLISKGERLYEGIFSHHMPLAYMAAHAVAAISPTDHFAHFRIVPWLAYVAVALSLVRRGDGRTWVGATIFLALVSVALPALDGYMLLTDTLWGAAFAILFVRFLVPFLLGSEVSRFDAAVGGAALATVLLGSLTVLYPVAAAAAAVVATAVLATERRRTLREISGAFSLSFLVVAASSIVWLLRFGSLPGFFDQAIMFNLVAYAPFNPGASTPRELVAATFWAWKVDLGFDPILKAPEGIKRALTVISAMTALTLAGWIGRSAWSRPGRLRKTVACAAVPAFVVLAFEFLRMRGAGFHATALYLTVFASIGLGLDWLWTRESRKATLIGLAAVLLPLVASAAKDPTFRAGYPASHALSGIDDVASYVRERTRPSERIAVFPYRPLMYLEARRKPATGSVFYFPWQAFWERGDAPMPATCGRLLFDQPRFVFLSPQRLWEKFDWEDYAECIDRVIRRDYLQVEPERFEGHLWERSAIGEVRWNRLKKVGGGRFGLSGLEAGGPEARGQEKGEVAVLNRHATRLVRVYGWAEEDSGGPCEGRLFVILGGPSREIAVPAARSSSASGPGARWSGWSAVVYPQELRAGTYEVTVRVLRVGRTEYLESPSLAKLLLR